MGDSVVLRNRHRVATVRQLAMASTKLFGARRAIRLLPYHRFEFRSLRHRRWTRNFASRQSLKKPQ
jgi:hypothetical protein